jgi:V8-like Glu-specific endopeptidase
MGTKLLVALEVALLLLASASVSAADAISTTTIRALGSVVDGQYVGTAFHLGNGCWMTAAHTVESASVNLVLWNGRAPFAHRIGSHPTADVSVLKGPAIVDALGLASTVPARGDRVWIVGFPGDSRRYPQPVPSTGRVLGIAGTGHLLVDAMAFPGHSGSPVLNREGRVAGVLTNAHRTRLDRILAEPLPFLRPMARRCGSG